MTMMENYQLQHAESVTVQGLRRRVSNLTAEVETISAQYDRLGEILKEQKKLYDKDQNLITQLKTMKQNALVSQEAL